MVTGDNIVTATAIAKDCDILGNEVNLDNITQKEVEEDPDLKNDLSERELHIQNVLKNKPKAIPENTFYTAIAGLFCKTCNLDTNLWKCTKKKEEDDQIVKKKWRSKRN